LYINSEEVANLPKKEINLYLSEAHLLL